MKNYSMALTEQQQRLSTGKLDKYDYLTGEEILPPQKK